LYIISVAICVTILYNRQMMEALKPYMLSLVSLFVAVAMIAVMMIRHGIIGAFIK